MNRKMIFIIIVCLSVFIVIFAIIMSSKKDYNTYNSKYPVMEISYDTSDFHKNKKMEFYMYNTSSNQTIKSMGKLEFGPNGNYSFELSMMSPGRNERENPISIFNMEPSSKYRLNLINTDNSKMKENNNIVELYINNEHKGIFILESLNVRKGGRGNG